MAKKKEEITIRSSAAEYLTYVASVGDRQDSVEMRYEDENIWLTQKMMATLSVEQGINLRLVGEAYGNELLEKYKKKLCKMFDPSRAVQRGFSLEEAQRILSEFAAICANDTGRWYGDLALYFAECATDFTMTFGDMDEEFYGALGEAYHDAIVAASEDEELYKSWKDRIEDVLHAFDGFGWGMGEYISEAYYLLPWV